MISQAMWHINCAAVLTAIRLTGVGLTRTNFILFTSAVSDLSLWFPCGLSHFIPFISAVSDLSLWFPSLWSLPVFRTTGIRLFSFDCWVYTGVVNVCSSCGCIHSAA